MPIEAKGAHGHLAAVDLPPQLLKLRQRGRGVNPEHQAGEAREPVREHLVPERLPCQLLALADQGLRPLDLAQVEQPAGDLFQQVDLLPLVARRSRVDDRLVDDLPGAGRLEVGHAPGAPRDTQGHAARGS